MDKKHKKYLVFLNRVLDQAKKEQGYKSDTELAAALYDNKGNLSNYRHGTRTMSDWKLMRACKLANISVKEALVMILQNKSLKKEVEDAMKDLIELIKPEKQK